MTSRAVPGGSDTERFGGFIGPANLRAWLEGSAPYLFDGSHPRQAELPSAAPGAPLSELAAGPLGWWRVVREAERLPVEATPSPAAVRQYFVLCCAAHWASVATYVPTDVDAKIRRALWGDQRDPEELQRMLAFALELPLWSVEGFSQRLIPLEPAWGLGASLSGHDGELLSIWGGALAAAWQRGLEGPTARLIEAIDAELSRQARAFAALEDQAGRETCWVRAAAVLTHNAGDLNQGLEELLARGSGPPELERFARLVQVGGDRYGGAFGRAGEIYRQCLAAEGHRHYPLRAPKGLRRSAELGLPIAPLLDGFGARVASHPALKPAERFEVVQALLDGLRRVPGQQAYQRALRGFAEVHPRGLEDPSLLSSLSAAGRKALKEPELRKQLAVPQRAFESALVRRARQAAGST